MKYPVYKNAREIEAYQTCKKIFGKLMKQSRWFAQKVVDKLNEVVVFALRQSLNNRKNSKLNTELLFNLHEKLSYLKYKHYIQALQVGEIVASLSKHNTPTSLGCRMIRCFDTSLVEYQPLMNYLYYPLVSGEQGIGCRVQRIGT